MRKLLTAVTVLILAIGSFGQASSHTAFRVRFGASLPATCNPATGDVFFKNTATIGVYQCLTANTWTALSSLPGISDSGTILTFTEPLRGPNGSCATPTYSFSNGTTTGIAFAAGGTTLLLCANGGTVVDIQVSGASRFQIPSGVKVDFGGVPVFTATAPTIATHFNTSGDSIVGVSTVAFQVTVGTGVATSTGSLTLPAATTGWGCWLQNQTRGGYIQQTSNTTTSVTFTNYGTTVGTPVTWTNGDILVGGCLGF